jgi:iron complex transport system substrate-binding protein
VFTNLHRGAVAALVVSCVVLTACGGATTDTATAEGRTRTVTDATGEVQVPADPQRVLVLDEYAALSMLTVGARPDLVYLVFADPMTPQILDAEGIDSRAEPDFLSDPDFETIAADAPDLIVTSDAGPLASRVGELRAIAPTVSLAFGSGWRESAQQTAGIFGTDSDEVVAAVSDRVADVGAAVRGKSLSILLDYGTGLNVPTPDSPMALLAQEVGLTRPADQTTTDGVGAGQFIAPVSPESLPQQDADLVALLDGGSYDAATVRALPTFGRLSGTVADVDGTAWFGSSPFAMWWVLGDLEAMSAGRPVATAADTAALWDQYTTEVLGG